MGTEDQEGIPRRQKSIWKGPVVRGHVTHLRTWGKASGVGLNHSMSLTLEIFGLYPSCSRWEIVSRGAIGSELGLKDCSSLWAGKGPEGMRGNVDPLRFSGGRIFKYDQEERAGTQPGDQNLIQAIQYPTWRQSLVSPRMRQLWSLETRGACHKPQEEEERGLGTFPRVILIQQWAEMGLKGNLRGIPFSTTKQFQKLAACLSKSAFGGWQPTFTLHFHNSWKN